MSVRDSGVNIVIVMVFAMKKIAYSVIKNHLHHILWQNRGLLKMIFYLVRYCVDLIKNAGSIVSIVSIRFNPRYIVLQMINIVPFVEANNYVIKKIVRFVLRNRAHHMKLVEPGLQRMICSRGRSFFNPIKR